MPAPLKVSAAARGEILAVALARIRIPSDKELRLKHRISHARLHQIMREELAKLDNCLGSTKPYSKYRDPSEEALSAMVSQVLSMGDSQ